MYIDGDHLVLKNAGDHELLDIVKERKIYPQSGTGTGLSPDSYQHTHTLSLATCFQQGVTFVPKGCSPHTAFRERLPDPAKWQDLSSTLGHSVQEHH